ncbi:MAG TPA: MBL fold metallo-hydrolase, partial [Limnochordales bacterium]
QAVSAGTAGAPGGELVVHYLDVGQGDATLLQGPGVTILIDAGRHDRSDVVPHLEAAGVQSIDLFIGTHPHSDHIGQCAAVLERFPVREVWLTGHEHTTLTYERCLDAILATDARYHEPRAGETHTIGALRLEVLHPAQLTGDLNNDSIAVRVVYGSVVFLFTGDAEAEGEAAMLERGLPLAAHILHLGHHGSRTSSTAAFLAAVAPQVAIYSAGSGNSYGHPHAEALERVASVALAVYGTDVNGTIRVTTDGQTYTVVPEKGGPVTLRMRLGGDGRDDPGGAGAGSDGARDAAEYEAAHAADDPDPAGDGVGFDAGAACGPGQINVNSASAEELTRLVHVGPVLAERIVALRPFTSVADLARVPGLGPARVAAIEAQGLACAAVP